MQYINLNLLYFNLTEKKNKKTKKYKNNQEKVKPKNKKLSGMEWKICANKEFFASKIFDLSHRG